MHHQRSSSGKKPIILSSSTSSSSANNNNNSANVAIKNCIGSNSSSGIISNSNSNFSKSSKLGSSTNDNINYIHRHHQLHHQSQHLHTNINGNNNSNNSSSSSSSNTNNNNSSSNSNNNNSNSSSGPLDSLPKAFVISMKTLFDILDDQQTGYVKFEDIEKGWQDDGSKGLPHGVIDSLRKVTPLNGLLSFERFCAGLKICLLRNQTTSTIISSSSNNNHSTAKNLTNDNKCKNRRLSSDNLLISNSNNKINGGSSINKNNINNNNNCKEYSPKTSPTSLIRPPSAPLLDIENPMPNTQWNSNTATVRPMPGQRTLSLPQLSPGVDSDDLEMLPQLESIDPLMVIHQQQTVGQQELYGGAPPKPPRTGLLTTQNSSGLNTGVSNSGPTVINLPPVQSKQISSSGIDKAEIRSALQNWQMGVLMNEMESKDKWCHDFSNRFLRSDGDGGGSTDVPNNNSGLIRIGPQSLPHQLIEILPNQQIYPKKSSSKRREPRRHTLQNGIDYNLLRRLKQYEEERDLLYQGFSAVEKAREWYLQQIAVVQEKIRYLGRMGSHVEQWSEVHQERLDFQRARVQEINRHLSTLADTWERGGFPMHMNLAVCNGHAIRGARGVLVRPIEKD